MAEALSLLTPSNLWRTFSYHTKMADFESILVKKIGMNMSVLNMASSDNQIDKPQRGRPKNAELPDANINTAAQSINSERASLILTLMSPILSTSPLRA